MSIAVLVLLLLIAIYWYAWRPLPKESGEIAAPISAAATITRDSLGVPHIEAATWQDAIFLQGYVTAQDRLWQMDSLRRFGAGELAEVFGAKLVEQDTLSRRMRMRAIAEAYWRGIKPNERATLVQYARGVNFYIRQQRGNLPLEFRMPGHHYDPREWSPVDTLLIGLVMYRDLTTSWKDDFARGNLFSQSSHRAHAEFLFPKSAGQYIQPGSNAWAVSGSHTVDGKAMLANDPHLAYSMPSIWHMVHLKAPGLDVIGVTLPGVPCVISGHNQNISWGVTNVGADYQDLYEEQLDPKTGRYLFDGKPQQASLDRQMIGIYGGAPVEVNTWVTRHGPIIFSTGKRSYALRWTATDGFGFPFLDLDRASTWDEFCAALRSFWGPPQNFIYADKAGNIGYRATGAMLIRRDFDGDVPLDGSSGKFEWNGYVPFEQLPYFYNPASGIVATANQNPFPPDFAYRVNGNFADSYRVEQIRARLAAKSKLSVDDMLAIQTDVYSAYHYFLARQILSILAARPEEGGDLVRQAGNVLKPWNGQMDKDQAAPLITDLFDQEIDSELLKTVGGGRTFNLHVRPQVIQRLLQLRPSGWVPGDDWNKWLLYRFIAAIDAGRKMQGTPVSRWRYGNALRWKIAHPIGAQLPFVDRYFDIGPVSMSGAGTTVKQTTSSQGPSMRMVIDWGNIDRSVQNLATGESGMVASRHYKDQWTAYYTGKSFPMQFERITPKETLRVRPE